MFTLTPRISTKKTTSQIYRKEIRKCKKDSLVSFCKKPRQTQYEATLKGNNFLHFNHLKKDVGVANMVAYDIYEDIPHQYK